MKRDRTPADDWIDRVHAVMDTYKIPHNQDLRFISDAAYVLGFDLEFHVVPAKDKQP